MLRLQLFEMIARRRVNSTLRFHLYLAVYNLQIIQEKSELLTRKVNCYCSFRELCAQFTLRFERIAALESNCKKSVESFSPSPSRIFHELKCVRPYSICFRNKHRFQMMAYESFSQKK